MMTDQGPRAAAGGLQPKEIQESSARVKIWPDPPSANGEPRFTLTIDLRAEAGGGEWRRMGACSSKNISDVIAALQRVELSAGGLIGD